MRHFESSLGYLLADKAGAFGGHKGVLLQHDRPIRNRSKCRSILPAVLTNPTPPIHADSHSGPPRARSSSAFCLFRDYRQRELPSARFSSRARPRRIAWGCASTAHCRACAPGEPRWKTAWNCVCTARRRSSARGERLKCRPQASCPPPPQLGGLDLNISNGGCACLGSGVAPPSRGG